ncbi:hypothetical protein DFQ26_009173 [Actinomortierella ambigua]|nr:hypothetical protein DFQ26_009173 [Actinomortierella ambigua]
MPVSSTRRRNQPQRNYKEEDPDDMSLTEDSDALESADDEDQASSGYPYEDAEDFDMEEDEGEEEAAAAAVAAAPQGRYARGGASRRKTSASPAKPPPPASSSSRSRAKSSAAAATAAAPPPPLQAKSRSAAIKGAATSSRSRKPPVNYIEDEDDEDDLMEDEDDEEEEEDEEEEQVQQQRKRDTRAPSRRSPIKRREFSPLSSEGEEEEQEIDMEEEEIDLEEGLEENEEEEEEEDIDVGMDEDEEEEEEDDDDEEEDDEEEEDEGEESTSTPSRGRGGPGGKKGASASAAAASGGGRGGRQKGKGRASASKGGAAVKGNLTDDEFSDDEDFSTPQPGMGFGGNLTKRQRSKLDGSEAFPLDFLELPSAASRKRHRTEEELALKKSELSRRRKNMTAQRAEQDKIDTINRLLKKQAGKRKKGGGDDEEGGAGGGGGGGGGSAGSGGTGEGGNLRRDQDSDRMRKVRHVIPPTYLRTICRVEGTTLSIPEVSLDRVCEWMNESIQEPKGVKPLVTVSAIKEKAEANDQISQTITKQEAGGEEASGDAATAEQIKAHKPIEILEEPLVPPKAPTYPVPRGHCAVEGCVQTWKYRGVKSKKQVCGVEHLRLIESKASQV